jgi:protein-L-isoaspartate(D-aspartate) O-methyltransferase
LVDSLTSKKWITQSRVESAFRVVPRHFFLPDLPLEEVYGDKAIVTKTQNGVPVSSSSQPAIMAVMLEQLDLSDGDNVLEIGAGTGYNAALLSHLVGATGLVTTLEIDEDVVAWARNNLERANVCNVELVHADGGLGYSPNAPYACVIATVGVWDLTPHWIEQLRDGGTLVAPLWFHTLQFSIAFEKHGSTLISNSICPCGFMRLRGAFAGPETFLNIDGLTVGVEDAAKLDVLSLRRLLESTPRERSLTQFPAASTRNLLDFMALHGEQLISLAKGEGKRFESEHALGLMSGDSSLLVMSFDPEDWQHISPTAHIFGDDSALLRLGQLVVEWEALGRPQLARTTITAAPNGAIPARANVNLIRKRCMEYQVDFGSLRRDL